MNITEALNTYRTGTVVDCGVLGKGTIEEGTALQETRPVYDRDREPMSRELVANIRLEDGRLLFRFPLTEIEL